MPPISTSFTSFSVPNDVNEVSFRSGFRLLRLLFLVNEVENEVFVRKIVAISNHIPCFAAPLIGILHEKVGSETCVHLRSRRYFVCAVPLFLEGQVEVFGLSYYRRINIVFGISGDRHSSIGNLRSTFGNHAINSTSWSYSSSSLFPNSISRLPFLVL